MIRDEVVLKLKSKTLATYSVFIPMVPADASSAAEGSATELARHGIKSYWDGDRKLGAAYADLYGNPNGLKVAWDVYFVYGPKAIWGKTPPKPSFYMHQLGGGDPALFLDGTKFRKSVEVELKKVKAAHTLTLLTRSGCAGTVAMRKSLDAALLKMAGWTYDLVDIDTLPAGDPRRGYPTPTLLSRGRDVFGMSEPAPGSDSPG